MGPSLIFDKSTLQSLNPDEAMWLDNFYLANITPLFFVETLADLEKEVRAGKTPEQVVGNLAYKTPDMGGHVNVHHQSLIQGELSAQAPIEMSGRPVISGGQPVMLGNQSGVIFQESPEAEAFKRWQKGEFLAIERSIAKKWRQGLMNNYSVENSKMFHQFFAALGTPKTFNDVKSQVDVIINMEDARASFVFGLSIMGILPKAQEEILKRWEKTGKKSIKEFAPYFAHVFSVDLFFYIGTAANLFSSFPHAQTHNIDVAYLYYLPFCNIFVSNDKLHFGTVPFFLRPDQTFVNGVDFKADLKKLDEHYSALPEETKNRGVVSFAFIPPADDSFLVARLWNKYMSPTWKKIKTKKFDGTDKVDPEADRAAVEKIRRFAKDSKPVERSAIGSSDEVSQVLSKHMVLAKKGKWRRFPPEVENSRPILD